MMSKRTRQYIGILFAIVAYKLVKVIFLLCNSNYAGIGSNIFVLTQWSVWWWRCKRNPLFNATGMDMDDSRLHITF